MKTRQYFATPSELAELENDSSLVIIEKHKLFNNLSVVLVAEKTNEVTVINTPPVVTCH